MCKLTVLAFALVLVLTIILTGERNAAEASGGYRKPPFNGSIFGKRTASEVSGSEATGAGSGGSAGGAGRAFPSYASFCEMAWETCFTQYLGENSR